MKNILAIMIVPLVVLAVALGFPSQQQAVYAQQAPTASTPPQQMGTTEGAGSTIFGNYCETCHGNPKVPSAPEPATLKQMSPDRIYQTLTTGDMVPMAAHLTDQQKRDIAEWVGGRKLGPPESGEASKMSNVCSSNPPIQSLTSTPSWNGWSPGIYNTRFQAAKDANLSPAAVTGLRLKWAFGLPSADSVYGQPTVVAGRVFVSSDAAYIYELDAKSGCVHWSFQAESGVRSAIIVGPTKPDSTKYAAFFGDIRGNIYSVDATNGKLLWKVKVDPHPLSRITGAIVLYKGHLYVPVASLEEPESSSANYHCCTFRGMVAAFDSATGKQIWKTYTLPVPPTPRKTAEGVSYTGPAGVGVWGPLAIDPKLNALYFGTGNTFSGPDMGRSDALMALDMATGRILWTEQDEANDVWHTGCPGGPAPAGIPQRGEVFQRTMPLGQAPHRFTGRRRERPPMPASYYCPSPAGPDNDFAAGPMLINMPDGHRLLIIGQKSGVVWAHDPDNHGALVWKSDVSRGEIDFGGATNGHYAYYAFRAGGIARLRLSDGLETWYRPITPQESMERHRGISAAVTLIPGVVFTAGLDGMLRAFNSFDGTPIWQYNTLPEVTTVNGVKAHGGSIGSAGPTVADGMVFVTSGYTGFQNGVPGNLLLAFGD